MAGGASLTDSKSTNETEEKTVVAFRHDIADQLHKCAAKFRNLINLPEVSFDQNQELVSYQAWLDEYDRLRTWAANIGAHQRGNASLDFRLRDASHIFDQIVDILQDLQIVLDDTIDVIQGTEPQLLGDADPELDVNIFDDNDDEPKEYQELYISTQKRVDCLFDLSLAIRKPAKLDTLLGIHKIQWIPFSRLDLEHVEHKLPAASKSIQQNLAAALTTRRGMLKYYENHQKKYARGIEKAFDGTCEQSESHGPDRSVGMATEYVPGHESQQETRSVSGDSNQSMSSLMNSSRALYIPIPPELYTRKPYQCPYCHYLLDIYEPRLFVRHVFEDITPYQCIFESCEHSRSLLASKSAWIQHLAESHGKDWEQAENTPCFMCGQTEIEEKSFQRHVARHLEDLAIFALPSIGDDDRGSILSDHSSESIDHPAPNKTTELSMNDVIDAIPEGTDSEDIFARNEVRHTHDSRNSDSHSTPDELEYRTLEEHLMANEEPVAHIQSERARAREAAAAEALRHRQLQMYGDIVYANANDTNLADLLPPAVPPGFASTMTHLPAMEAYDSRYRDVQRPRMENVPPPSTDIVSQSETDDKSYHEANGPSGNAQTVNSDRWSVNAGDGSSVSEQSDENGEANTAAHHGYSCTFPGCTAAPFSTQHLLNSHTNVHSNQRPHFCPVAGCPRGPGGQGFKRKNEMIRHGLVHQSPGYTCPFCPDSQHKYPRPDNLQRHVRVHHVEKDRDDPLLRKALAQRPDGGKRIGVRANESVSQSMVYQSLTTSLAEYLDNHLPIQNTTAEPIVSDDVDQQTDQKPELGVLTLDHSSVDGIGRRVTFEQPEGARDPLVDEKEVMRTFHKHVQQCDTCQDALDAWRSGAPLCPRGHNYVIDMGPYFFCKRGKPYSSIDRELRNETTRVFVPKNCEHVSTLFEAIGAGYNIKAPSKSSRPKVAIHEPSTAVSQDETLRELPTHVRTQGQDPSSEPPPAPTRAQWMKF